MAIYGIGAYHGESVSKKFLSQGVACVGWDPNDAPALHRILRGITVGDLIFIKSFPPNKGLSILAVGIVVDDEVRKVKGLGMGVKVDWIWRGNEFIGRKNDKYDSVRGITLYAEFNPDIQKKVMELLLKRSPRVIRRMKVKF